MAAKHIEELRSEPVENVLDRVINKYCSSMDVYYDYWPVLAQVLNQTPTGMVQEIRPMIQVGLMCKSKAIGEFLYGSMMMDMIPVEQYVEKGFLEVLEDLRNQLAQQGSPFNGQVPQGPTQSLKDRPQL